MSIEKNKAIVNRLFEALNAGVDAMTAARPQIFDANEISYFAGQAFDYAAHAQFDAVLLTAFPDIRFTVESLLADGDTVVARTSARGTQTGPFQGIPATGAAVTSSAIAIYRVAGHKIVEQWLEYDQLGLLQQLGAIPAQP
jgi:predicted ester cyclase